MNKVKKKTIIITNLIILLPAVIGILLWNELPEEMATHFSTDNTANGFSGRTFTVFGIPAFLLVLQWVLFLMTKADPKYKNISGKLFTLCLWIIPVTSILMSVIIYPYNLGFQINIAFLMELLMGVLMILLGNYLPKMRQNYTMGIKLPWTLADEENWNKTHRFAGIVWIIGGILIFLCTLLGMEPNIFLTVILLTVVLLPTGYSLLFYLKKKRN